MRKMPEISGGDIVGNQKFAELECVTRNGFRARAGHVIGKLASHGGRAATRERHDLVEVFKDIEIVMEEGFCGTRLARSQERLTATGLGFRENHVKTEGFQHIEGGQSDSGPELIDITGNEESDPHQARFLALRAPES